MLKDPDCATAIAGRKAGSAVGRAQSININSAPLGNFYVITDDNNDVIRLDQKRSAELANYRPGFLGLGRRITLNSAVTWSDPSATMGINQNGTWVPYNLLSATAYKIAADSVTGTQLMDLTILHELAHSYGLDHPTYRCHCPR